MNGLRANLAEIEAVKAGTGSSDAIDILLFPPATLVHAAAALAHGSPIGIGAQDCHTQNAGAFTGDLSAPMLKDAGASAVILGHSERRSGHGETSHTVCAKTAAALNAGLQAIVCVGETKGERAAGLASSVCLRQLAESLPDGSSPADVAIAYEPVWAIGSGVSPVSDEITVIHKSLRAHLEKRFPPEAGKLWRILYGGSVTPANGAAIFAADGVDGVLVGGASLNARSFLAIITSAQQASERRKP